MSGDWDEPNLDQVMYKLFTAPESEKWAMPWRELFGYVVRDLVLNPQVGAGAFEVGEHHYDLGNDLFEAMLDGNMSYTCGYWRDARDLEQAQQAKLERICGKLNLQPGMHVLDIGCGWGNFAEHAARKYGVKVTGLTVSAEQADLARKRCRKPSGRDPFEGLPGCFRAIRSDCLDRND